MPTPTPPAQLAAGCSSGTCCTSLSTHGICLTENSGSNGSSRICVPYRTGALWVAKKTSETKKQTCKRLWKNMFYSWGLQNKSFALYKTWLIAHTWGLTIWTLCRQFVSFLQRFWPGCWNSWPHSEAAGGGGVREYQGRSRGVRSRDGHSHLAYPVYSAIPLAQFCPPKERADVLLAKSNSKCHWHEDGQSLPWCSTESHQPVHIWLKVTDTTSGLQTMKSVSASQRTVTGIKILQPGRKKSNFEEQKLKCSAANSLLPHVSQAHPKQLSMLFRSQSTKNFKCIKTEKEKGFRCNNQPYFSTAAPSGVSQETSNAGLQS